jgi:hypothetical protein
MLLRDLNRTVKLHYNGKKDVYEITLRWESDGAQHVNTFMISSRDWESDDRNDFRSFLINNQMGSLWPQLQEMHTDSIDKILSNVTMCKNYGIQTGIDIYFRDNVFRLHEKDYIYPTNFMIWYLATMQRMADIKDNEEWQDFVAQCLRMAEREKYDPLEPDVVGDLVEMLKDSTHIHSDFCDVLYTLLKGSPDNSYFVIDKENKAVYVPKVVTAAISTKEKISRKRIRQFLTPFLLQLDDVRMYVGIRAKPKLYTRYWLLSLEKLAEYDAGAIEEMLGKLKDCATECETEEQEVEKIVGEDHNG